MSQEKIIREDLVEIVPCALQIHEANPGDNPSAAMRILVLGVFACAAAAGDTYATPAP